MSAQGHHTRIITIDGPAGSGKSAVARRLANRLGLEFLDTGAMYRGVAAAAIDRGIDPADPDAAGRLAEGLEIAFDWTADPPPLKIDGIDMTRRLRDADVTKAVSDIASNTRVRDVLVRSQRRIGREHPGLVTEGRDQGSVVFPDAPVKFYLDASPEVRARRRTEQLRSMGREADEQTILREIILRDERDLGRPTGPLARADDAIRIDSSDMTLDRVVEVLAERVGDRIGDPGGAGGAGGEMFSGGGG